MDRYTPQRNVNAQTPRRSADDNHGYGADFRPDEARGADDARSGAADVYCGHEEYSRGRGVCMPNEAGGGMSSYSGRPGRFTGRGPRNYVRPDESIQDKACQWLSESRARRERHRGACAERSGGARWNRRPPPREAFGGGYR